MVASLFKVNKLSINLSRPNCVIFSNSNHDVCGIPSAYSAFKMTGSSSAINRDDPRASPRPSPRMKTGSFRKGKAEPIERKDTDSIGSDTRSRSGSMSSVDSSDQLQEGRGKFEKVSIILFRFAQPNRNISTISNIKETNNTTKLEEAVH